MCVCACVRVLDCTLPPVLVVVVFLSFFLSPFPSFFLFSVFSLHVFFLGFFMWCVICARHRYVAMQRVLGCAAECSVVVARRLSERSTACSRGQQVPGPQPPSLPAGLALHQHSIVAHLAQTGADTMAVPGAGAGVQRLARARCCPVDAGRLVAAVPHTATHAQSRCESAATPQTPQMRQMLRVSGSSPRGRGRAAVVYDALRSSAVARKGALAAAAAAAAVAAAARVTVRSLAGAGAGAGADVVAGACASCLHCLGCWLCWPHVRVG